MMRNCKEPRALASLFILGLILKRGCWDKFAIGLFSSLKVFLHVTQAWSVAWRALKMMCKCWIQLNLNLIVYFIYLWASFLKSEWFLLGICREDGPWNWMELSHLSQRGWPSLGRPRKQCNSVRQEYWESLWHPGWCKCFWAGWWWETCQLEKGPHWICWKK